MPRFSPSRVRGESGWMLRLSNLPAQLLTNTAVILGSVNLRLATPADAAAIVAIENEAASAAHWSPAQYAGILAHDSQRVCLVLEDESRVLGFVVARLVEKECELENIAVAAPAQRRGLGSALITGLVKEARSRKAEAIFLEVRESNTAALRLYGKCGFIETGRRKSYYSDPREDAILYTQIGRAH